MNNDQQEKLAAIFNNNQNNNNGLPPRFNVNNNQLQQMRPQSAYLPYNDYTNNGFQQNQQFQNFSFKCRPVSSKAEARTYQIDLDGSLWIFTDPAHERIYTKQIQNDGSSTFKTYVQQKEEQNIYGDDYVTRNDLAKTVEYIISLISPQQNNTNIESKEENKTDKTSMNF